MASNLLPEIDPSYNIISSLDELKALSPFQYTEKFIFVGMVDSGQISKRGNLVINLINPSIIDGEYITNKKDRGLFGFLGAEVQAKSLKAFENKFTWKPVGNTVTYFKLGMLVPALVTCTVQSSNSVHPPFLMCESVDILSYKQYLELAANCNIPQIREIVTKSIEVIKKLHDDPNIPFSIVDSKSGRDDANLIRNFQPQILETMREDYLAMKILAERAEQARKAEQEKKEEEAKKKEQEKKEAQEKLLAEKISKQKVAIERQQKIAEKKNKAEPIQYVSTQFEIKSLGKNGATSITKKEVPNKAVNENTHTEDDIPLSQFKPRSISTDMKDTTKQSVITSQKKQPSIHDKPEQNNEEELDQDFFGMDIPQFETQKEAEPAQPEISKTKPKAVQLGDMEFFSDSDESDYDMVTGKRKETSKTPLAFEPALKKSKQAEDGLSSRKLFISESFNGKSQQKPPKRNDSQSSGFLSDDNNDFYNESNMADVDQNKNDDSNAENKSKVHNGTDVLSQFFGDVPVKATPKKYRSHPEIIIKPPVAASKNKLFGSKTTSNSSESNNMKIFSMAEDNMSSQSIIPATADSMSYRNKAIQQQEIIVSQPSNHTTPAEMVSKGIQTPMNFLTFNILYNQAVVQAKSGEAALINEKSVVAEENPKSKAQLKKERKAAAEVKKQKKEEAEKELKASAAEIKPLQSRDEVEVTKTSNSPKKTEQPSPVKAEKVVKSLEMNRNFSNFEFSTAEVTEQMAAYDNSKLKNNQTEVKNNQTEVKNNQTEVKKPVVTEAKPVRVVEVAKSRDLKVSLPPQSSKEITKPVESVKSSTKSTLPPFNLKPNGFSSKIHRLVKNAKTTEPIDCVVVGMVPFEDSIDLGSQNRLTLNVVEASDFKTFSKLGKLESVTIDLHVKNTALLAETFKVKTGKQLYDCLMRLFFCDDDQKPLQFIIKKETDGSFTWLQKYFHHEDIMSGDLDPTLQDMYPVKRGDLPLPTSTPFGDLNLASIGAFSTNVLLVGIRCKKGTGSGKYRLLVTDFTDCRYFRTVSVPNVTVLGDRMLSNVYEVFVGHDVWAEGLFEDLSKYYSKDEWTFNFNSGIDSNYFKDIALGKLGIVLSLKYSTKFYSNMLDIRYLSSTLLTYGKGFAGSIEAMKQLKSLYERFDAKLSKDLLGECIDYIKICMPYSSKGANSKLFADKYDNQLENKIKKQVLATLIKITDADKLSIYEKVFETKSLRDLFKNRNNTNTIFQLTNYELRGAKYMSTGCVEFEVGVFGETGTMKFYALPQSIIRRMFSKRDDSDSTYPIIYNEIAKLEFPTSPKTPLFLCSYKIDFRNDGCPSQYWVMIGFSSIW